MAASDSSPSCEWCAWFNRRKRSLTPCYDRFSLYVLKVNTGCWLWAGEVNHCGYGRFYAHGAKFAAHRFAWFLANGKIPKRLFVCHTCDVRLCVNPSHLFLGTNSDNMRDMVAKHRDTWSANRQRTMQIMVDGTMETWVRTYY